MVPATDVGVTLTDFGEEIFFELEIYAGIGFGALGAIRSGTRDAARYMQLDHVTGTLKAGLAADILVVDGRPHEDITDLRRGRLVVANGTPIQATPAPPPPDGWLEMLGLGGATKVARR